MKIEELAVVVYGVLTILLAAALSVMAGSFWGLASAGAAAGSTYLFQILQLRLVRIDFEVELIATSALWGLAIIFTLFAFGFPLLG